MRSVRILLALVVAAGIAAAGPVEEARDRIRNGTAAEARPAIDSLVAADSEEAAKALQQGVESVLTRLKREQSDYEKKTKEFVKFQDTMIDLASKVVQMIADRKDGTAEYKALRKKQDQAREKNAKLKADHEAAKAKVTCSEEILLAAFPAFGRFRSDGAVAVIERAAAAKSGRLSRACTAALVRIGADRSQPVLADLCGASDTVQRAIAVRGLKVGQGDVPDGLKRCLADKAWQVRYAAYGTAATAPAQVAIMLLFGAPEKVKEDKPRTDFLLYRLAMTAPEGPPSLKGWLPQPPEDPVTDAVHSSQRLAVLLDSYPDIGREASERAKQYFEPTRAEVKRAIAAITEGSMFTVVAGHGKSGSTAPARATAASLAKAGEWVDSLPELPGGPPDRMLWRYLVSEPDTLEDMDTVVFVSAVEHAAAREAVDLLVEQIGEMYVAPTVHCVGVGAAHDAYLFACVALQTGGAYVGKERTLYAKVPAPGADPWTVGTVRVSAYRALDQREGERDALAALVTIGEDAYPLLPMIVDCLGADKPDDVRVEACAVLGAMGVWARSALPRVQKLAVDGVQEVADAARAAAGKISAP